MSYDQFKDLRTHLCEPYHDTKKAHIYAIASMAVAPIIPFMMSLVVAITVARIKAGEGGGATLWLLMKGMNKMIALETAPLAFALWYSSTFVPLPDWATYVIALFILGILFVAKTAAVEHYTNGILTLEVEAPEPEIPKPESA